MLKASSRQYPPPIQQEHSRAGLHPENAPLSLVYLRIKMKTIGSPTPVPSYLHCGLPRVAVGQRADHQRLLPLDHELLLQGTLHLDVLTRRHLVLLSSHLLLLARRADIVTLFYCSVLSQGYKRTLEDEDTSVQRPGSWWV